MCADYEILWEAELFFQIALKCFPRFQLDLNLITIF